MNRRFFVYILCNRRRGILYIGLSNDLIRRISEHKAKLVPGFTKTYGVVMLVYYEEYSSIVEARAREATLKRWRRAPVPRYPLLPASERTPALPLTVS